MKPKEWLTLTDETVMALDAQLEQLRDQMATAQARSRQLPILMVDAGEAAYQQLLQEQALIRGQLDSLPVQIGEITRRYVLAELALLVRQREHWAAALEASEAALQPFVEASERILQTQAEAQQRQRAGDVVPQVRWRPGDFSFTKEEAKQANIRAKRARLYHGAPDLWAQRRYGVGLDQPATWEPAARKEAKAVTEEIRRTVRL